MAQPLRALVVEDSDNDARLLLRELERGGFAVSWERVETEGAMRSALADRTWDLVLADYTMPAFSAPAALALVQEAGLDLPFIIVSGTVGEETAVEAMKAGAHDYLLKGKLKRLIPAIQRELDQAAHRRARRDVEEHYRLIFENSPHPMWVADCATLRFLRVNDAGVEHYGYSREEFLAMTTLEIRPPEKMAAVRDSDGLERAGLWKHRKKDGTVIDVEVTTQGLTLSGRRAWLTLAYDVTERRRAQESVQKLLLAVEQAENVIFITDPDGRITYVNPSFEITYGFGKSEVLGKTPRILKSGQYDEGFYRQLWRSLLSSKGYRGEIVNRARDGRLVTVEVFANPVFDADGKRIGFIAVQHDVTRRNLLEAQFHQAQKMEAVGQLAGGIAHDFNNLLTAILGYADLLAVQAGANGPLSESIGEIRKAGERAASLTRQLLAFSRRQVLELKVLEVNVLVENLEKMLGRVIGEDMNLETRLDPSAGNVRADPGQLEQVIMNLAVNARDAMPRGGKLTIETAQVDLDDAYALGHAAVRPGNYVMLAVSDTGAGMDEATQARAFEPFFTTKEKGKGTGLGLSTVYGIIKQSGGYVWLYSEPGKGTTFKVYLPRVEGEPALPEPPAPVGPSRGTETILLVEDEQSVRSLSRRILEARGYRVLEARKGSEAMDVAGGTTDRIDLVLTDLVMPEMAGTELVSRLKARRPEVRVLYMSGYTDDAAARNGLLEHGQAFLQKPFTADALSRKVREALS